MGGMLLCVLVVFMLFGLIAIFLPQSRFSLKILNIEIFFEQTKAISGLCTWCGELLGL